MHLCSLSITYACPYHKPTATMGYTTHNIDISKPLTHTTPYTLSALYSENRDSSVWIEHLSKVPDAIECEHLPTQSVMTTNSSQVETPMRTTSMQMRFPETVSDSLCRNYLVMQTDCCSSCPGGWSQTILEVKMLDVEVQGWCGYTWSAVVRPVGWPAKFSETPLETAYGREINIQFKATSLVDIPADSMPIACSLKTCDICGFVLCDKLHILEWPFIVASVRHTCAITLLSNQHLDMPHLWGG